MSVATGIPAAQVHEPGGFRLVIPRTWDDAAIASLEVPLADPMGSPKHVSAGYYYRIPVPPIYRSYPAYAPGHEPSGYLDWLKQQEPVIVWGADPKTGVERSPHLRTKEDWIRAGEMVFDAPISFETGEPVSQIEVRNPRWYLETGTPIAKDGTFPFAAYVVRKKGEVELGELGCRGCHTRVMPDGSVVRGAQGSFPSIRSIGFEIGALFAQVKNPAELLANVRSN